MKLKALSCFMCTLLMVAVLCGCRSGGDKETGIDPSLAAELVEMCALDQQMEMIAVNGSDEDRTKEFYEKKQNIQDNHAARCKQIFEQIGYPGSDKVGAEASEAFWLLVQHSDSDPVFQERVAEAMILEVERGTASGAKLAYLTDRVRTNTGRKQVYGTQLDFDLESARAMPKPIEHPRGVDERREAVGLEPLWVYMNDTSLMHYEMNKEQYKSIGIQSAWVYEEGYLGW